MSKLENMAGGAVICSDIKQGLYVKAKIVYYFYKRFKQKMQKECQYRNF